MSKELTRRNFKMYQDWFDGMDYKQIAIKHKENYETVCSIVKRYMEKVSQGLILKNNYGKRRIRRRSC